MPRVIVQNRIPRVNLANRSIGVPPVAGASVATAAGIGDVRLFTPGTQPSNYVDAAVAGPMVTVPPGGPLLAAQGPLTGLTSVASAVNAASGGYAVVMWNGAIWQAAFSGGGTAIEVRKRTLALGAPGSLLFNNALACQGQCKLFAAGSRLMAVFGDTTPNTRIMTITNDTTATGLVIAAGNPGIYDVQEGAPGSGVFIAGAGNGIYRTTDSGASWTNITSTLGIKTWGRIFYQGGNVWHMFAQDGSFALSSDNGLTWTLTTVGSITNATGIQQNIQASYRVCVALDPVTGLYVILTAGGGIRTTPVSAPTGGWTIVTANGDLNTGYTDFCMTSAFMIAFNKGAMSYCLRTNLATWLKNIVLPSSVATFEPTSEMYEFGDGLLSWDMNNQNSAGAKLCYQIADGVNTFDHYVLPASVPVLLNGKKPYVRVS